MRLTRAFHHYVRLLVLLNSYFVYLLGRLNERVYDEIFNTENRR